MFPVIFVVLYLLIGFFLFSLKITEVLTHKSDTSCKVKDSWNFFFLPSQSVVAAGNIWTWQRVCCSWQMLTGNTKTHNAAASGMQITELITVFTGVLVGFSFNGHRAPWDEYKGGQSGAEPSVELPNWADLSRCSRRTASIILQKCWQFPSRKCA